MYTRTHLCIITASVCGWGVQIGYGERWETNSRYMRRIGWGEGVGKKYENKVAPCVFFWSRETFRPKSFNSCARLEPFARTSLSHEYTAVKYIHEIRHQLANYRDVIIIILLFQVYIYTRCRCRRKDNDIFNVNSIILLNVMTEWPLLLYDFPELEMYEDNIIFLSCSSNASYLHRDTRTTTVDYTYTAVHDCKTRIPNRR